MRGRHIEHLWRSWAVGAKQEVVRLRPRKGDTERKLALPRVRSTRGVHFPQAHVCILASQAMMLFLEVAEHLEGTLRGGA